MRIGYLNSLTSWKFDIGAILLVISLVTFISTSRADFIKPKDLSLAVGTKVLSTFASWSSRPEIQLCWFELEQLSKNTIYRASSDPLSDPYPNFGKEHASLKLAYQRSQVKPCTSITGSEAPLPLVLLQFPSRDHNSNLWIMRYTN